ncbi:MAG: 1-acyl-sn-glycerol-3-phosphate acyltransferase [Puniceicoccales bacterium]|jgi:1-acyl-sn-glycerol-3-phosphate acyltransferase|nr:1-acyl-sn-glycerol-3-phosphate acyltransferase [Puniceicoccales bacterium]
MKQGAIYDDPMRPPFLFAISRWFFRVVVEDFFDVEFWGEEHVPQCRACILAANHCSFLDPPAVAVGCIRSTFSLARKTLFKPGIRGRFFSQLLTIPVDRDGAGDISAIRNVLQKLKAGQSILIFPEGKRSLDGEIQPLKRGIGLLAARAQAPVVPVRVFGSHWAWNSSMKNPKFFVPLRVVYGPPLMPEVYDPGPAHEDRYGIITHHIHSSLLAISSPQQNS